MPTLMLSSPRIWVNSLVYDFLVYCFLVYDFLVYFFLVYYSLLMISSLNISLLNISSFNISSFNISSFNISSLNVRVSSFIYYHSTQTAVGITKGAELNAPDPPDTCEGIVIRVLGIEIV